MIYKKIPLFALLLLGLFLIVGCTKPTTLSYEPTGADQLVPPMQNYTKVDLEGQTSTVASLVTGSVAGVAGANPATAAVAARKMQVFADCLAQNNAVAVKGFYSTTRASSAVIAVGEGDSKKMLACALKSAFTASVANPTPQIVLCSTTYSTQTPSGKSYYVGIIGFDSQSSTTICNDLCVNSVNGCNHIDTILVPVG